jgi:hypothetical protein
MDTKEIFSTFLEDLKSTFPDVLGELGLELDLERSIKTIETDFFPHVLKILQKDPEFFSERRMLFGINLSSFFNHESKSTQDAIWKHLQLSLMASFTHGDIKEKVGVIIDIAKSYFSKSGQGTDKITAILEDKKSVGYLQEILDYALNTKIAKIFTEIVEQIDINEFDLNIESPEDLVNMFKNPEHPTIQKAIQKIQGLIKSKLEKGSLKNEDIRNEIETIKAKITGFFGNAFNDMMGLKKGETPSAILTGNSPEARRQRMIARLQKKHRDKNSQ